MAFPRRLLPHVWRLRAVMLVGLLTLPLAAAPASANWWSSLTKLERGVPEGDLPKRSLFEDGAILSDLARRAHLPEQHMLLTFTDETVGVMQHLGRGRYGTRKITEKAKLAEVWRDPQAGELIIPDRDLIHLSAWIPEGDGTRPVLVVDEGGSISSGKVLTTGGRAQVLVHLSEHLDFAWAPGADLMTVRNMLKVPFARGDARVVSLFDDRDVDILSSLDAAAGDTHRVMPDVTAAKMAQIAEGGRERLVIVVGHVEDGSFVVRSPDGGVRSRVRMADVERVLDDRGAIGLFLGCQTAAVGVSGFPHCVNVLQVADGLRSIQHARTYGEVLDGVAASAGGLVVEGRFVNNTLQSLDAHRRLDLLERRLNQTWFAVRLTAGPQRVEKATSRIESVLTFFLGPLTMFWTVGAIIGIFSFRSEWRAYRDAFPAQPGWYTSSARRLAIKGARFLAFIIFVPFFFGIELVILGVSAVFIFLFAINGWYAALALALVAAISDVLVNWNHGSTFKAAAADWRSAIIVGGLGLLVAASAFNLDPSDHAAPPLTEQLGLLIVAALVAAALLLIRQRWHLGSSDLPLYLFYRSLFVGVAWLDRVTRSDRRSAL